MAGGWVAHPSGPERSGGPGMADNLFREEGEPLGKLSAIPGFAEQPFAIGPVRQ